ncbi:MAG: type I restriction enzyme HsdR N-terminal domain-containing protein [Filimonas sp.]|nr:type I restriction enzyme HsdR N-terminal domain-containing protein [Filimonas sp.]
MVKITFPQHNYRIKEEGNKEFIFDEARKQWVRLTPEEWVRQNFIQYLLQVKKYPLALMAVEKEIVVGEMKKRGDIVVYRGDKPWMIIECKEMNVPLTDAVAMQVFRYNIPLRVQYLVVTNGSYTFCMDTATGNVIAELPEW